MKILDRYILTSYLKTFISVFVILMLIFVLQAIWLYIKELAGKDLDVITVLKFLFYITPTLIPLILPLTILLASIMVFGNFAENYEFAAMKSTGISLQRAMASLSVFIFFLSILTFFFSNNIIPRAEYESYNLRKNIAKVKPAMAIAEGQFNQIVDNFNIKVAKKTGDRGQFLENVVIHKGQAKKPGNHVTIVAKTGELVSAEDSETLKLILFDGYYYDDTPPNKHKEKVKKPFVKSEFLRYTINLDLSQLGGVDLEEKNTDNKYSMLAIGDLKYTTDSLITERKNEFEKFGTTLYNRTNIATVNLSVETKKDTTYNNNVIDLFNLKQKIQLLDYAINATTSTKQIVTAKEANIKGRTIWLNKHIIALHEKFALAIACIILFFVGAPLGALIRKGGLGLPMVMAIVIFLSYHFIGIFAKNSARDGSFNPVLASWFSTLIMLPLSIYLTSRATKDRGLLETDGILEPLKKFFKIKTKKTEFSTKVFNVNSDDYKVIQSLNDSKLIAIVKDYRSFDYTVEHKNTAISVLTSRGITRQELKMAGHLNNDFLEEASTLKNDYEEDSKLAFILYSIGLVLILGGRILINNKLSIIGNALFVIGIIAFLIFIFALSKSFSKHTNLYKHLGKNNSINGVLFSLLGFPLYFIFYFIQKKQIKKDLNTIEFGNNNNATKEVDVSRADSTIIKAPINQEQKALVKISIATLALTLVLVVFHFVFANNKLPIYASASIQLSIVSLIVSIFYFIKNLQIRKNTIKGIHNNKSIEQPITASNTAKKELKATTSKNLIKLSLGVLILSILLVILHFVFANNKLPLYASASLQLSVISFIVSGFYFIKSKLS
ncbi:LptF/LptG family permease [uncultured Lacinutrix sp.]|uniref:LptF/LptG family permease n=1 Tax=uncultured Lacinutrix sp. TaxID=574032 RepID=UPI00262C8524|nr:LptF/LptG family permease [uncultured Lacinutrix sp.]